MTQPRSSLRFNPWTTVQRRHWGTLGCVFILLSCGSGDSQRIKESHPRIAATRDLRIGSATDADAGFTRIGSVAVDPGGRVLVYEESAAEIRMFDDDGSPLSILGGRGEGPGEFRSVSSIGVVGDTVWALDPSLRRITLFSVDGARLAANGWEDVTAIADNGEQQAVRPSGMGENGRLIADIGRIPGNGSVQVNGETDTIKVPRLEFDWLGAVVDTVGWRPLSELPRPPRPRMANIGGVTYGVYPAPPDWPLLIGTPDGWALIERRRADASKQPMITVSRYDHAGGMTFRREVPYEPREYGDTALNTMALMSASNPGAGPPGAGGAGASGEPTAEVVAAIREQLDFPKFQMPVRRAWLANDGSIWLLREELDSPVEEWLIVGPAGEVRGELELPRGSRPAWAANEILWSVEADSMGVQWLTRYRLSGQ